MPLILWLACAVGSPPPAPAPPPPPPTDEQACRAGDRPACGRIRAHADADRAAGAWERAASGYQQVCAGLPGDVACVLHRRVSRYGEPRAACAATRDPAACAAADLGDDGESLLVRAAATLSGALPGTPAEAAVLLWRSCEDHKHAAACLALAELGARGEPLPPGTRGDVQWLRDQACDLQLAYACAPHRW